MYLNRFSANSPNTPLSRETQLLTVVLVLICINQTSDPLIAPTWHESLLFWVVRPAVFLLGLWLAETYVASGRPFKWIPQCPQPDWFEPVVIVSAIGLVPLTLIEVVLEQALPFRAEFMDEGVWEISPVLAYANEFVTLASLVIPIHLFVWLMCHQTPVHASLLPHEAGARGSTDELPLPALLLKAGCQSFDELIALEAEEHYVRVYTRAGSALVAYRFGTAVTEVPARYGMRVHRSWWVADTGVIGAARGDRRWRLNLGDMSVPVSDSYLAGVRDRGWLSR